jgi:voltage-gated potassium channel
MQDRLMMKRPTSGRRPRKAQPRVSSFRGRLLRAILLILVITVAGTLGYLVIEGWTLLDALYMTIISMTTVGYGETQELTEAGRVFTIFLLISSIGTAGYTISTLASFIVEGEFQRILRGRRMDKRIASLGDHIILCGGGRTGIHIAEELHKTHTPFVVIEQNPNVIEQLLNIGDILHLQADATQDESLLLAGIGQARGLFAVLGEDKDNVFVALSARALNPHLRIVARLIDEDNAEKLHMAGADEVVSPNAIGGLRMASVMLRPTVVNFLDEMLRAPEQTLRVEEVHIDDVPSLAGQTLGHANIGCRTGLLVVASKPQNRGYQFNPGAQTRLQKGDILIVIGTPEQIDALRKT